MPELPLNFVARNCLLRYLVQTLLIFAVIAVWSGMILTTLVFAFYVLLAIGSEVFLLLAFPIAGLASQFCHIIAKWVVIGKYKEGKYPLWDGCFVDGGL